ncbi:AAA family ATPase [Seinonella peptonophila]|uniref:AAA family ATPase n=1 Tax=Seinonella peptonophila TaxID=112248 RepID=UPI000932E590|nr:AAA family ATPase [Seinonella peptonophila]
MNKQMIIVAGLYGSGKSTFRELLHPTGIILDADEISKKLNSKYTMRLLRIFLARREMNRTLKNTLNRNLDFLIEYTLVFQKPLRKMKLAKKKGYQISLHFISLNSPSHHIQNVAKRVRYGGHSIPKLFIRFGYPLCYFHFLKALKYANTVTVWGNSGEFKKIMEIRDNKIIYINEPLPSKLKNLKSKIQKSIEKERSFLNMPNIKKKIKTNQIVRS